MAIVNIKNLLDRLRRKLLLRVPLCILDLQGLGKEHWQGIDASEHVRRERDSWS